MVIICFVFDYYSNSLHVTAVFILQFLSKTVSGVLHTIKDALPHFDDDDVHGKFVGSENKMIY